MGVLVEIFQFYNFFRNSLIWFLIPTKFASIFYYFFFLSFNKMLGLFKANSRLFNVLFKHINISQSRNYKVTILGGAGGVGQPLSLLLKLNPLVTDLTLFDIPEHTIGLAKDLADIDTLCEVSGYKCPEDVPKALSCADVVVCTAGVARKPGQDRNELFPANVEIVKGYIDVVITVAPKAMICIITNPINAIVPMIAEHMKKCEAYDPKRLFGVSNVDVVRSRSFIGDVMHRDPRRVQVRVIGGHSFDTILPLLSSVEPPLKQFEDEEDFRKLTQRIMMGGNAVTEAKAGAGSSTLGTAYACALFVDSLLKGLSGVKGIVECAYVESTLTEASFFASPIRLGKNGVEEILPLPCLSKFEQEMLQCILPILQEDIKRGVDGAE